MYYLLTDIKSESVIISESDMQIVITLINKYTQVYDSYLRAIRHIKKNAILRIYSDL